MTFISVYYFFPEKMKLEKVENLVANLHDKTEYATHIRNLKQALNHEFVLKKVHKIIKFKQKTWLKSYVIWFIYYKYEQRSTKKGIISYFEKDFFGLRNNRVFGKAMENWNLEILNVSQLKEE